MHSLLIYFQRYARFYPESLLKLYSCVLFKILITIFLLFRRADLTASALLQGIRSEGPRIHALRLASAATSTCE